MLSFVHSLIRSSVYSFSRLFVHPFNRPFLYSFVCLSTRSFIYSVVGWFVRRNHDGASARRVECMICPCCVDGVIQYLLPVRRTGVEGIERISRLFSRLFLLQAKITRRVTCNIEFLKSLNRFPTAALCSRRHNHAVASAITVHFRSNQLPSQIYARESGKSGKNLRKSVVAMPLEESIH